MVTTVDTEHCRSCNDPIIWATNPASGKASPINAEPEQGGNVELYEYHAQTYFTVIPKAAAAERNDLRKSHFAVCRHAKEWRRKP
jgi:hypothetical protein